MVRVRHILPALLLWTAGATASTYFVNYRGASGLFPEKDGWWRYALFGGVRRGFENGSFFLDSRSSVATDEYYDMYRPGALDPRSPNEQFVLEWRAKIDWVQHGPDLEIGVASDTKRDVGFALDASRIYSVYEPGISASFTPGEFHSFRFVSIDLRSTYKLFIDGRLAIRGSLSPYGVDTSRVSWGESVEYNRSFSHWEYVRFGVVPQPGPTPGPSAWAYSQAAGLAPEPSAFAGLAVFMICSRGRMGAGK